MALVSVACMVLARGLRLLVAPYAARGKQVGRELACREEGVGGGKGGREGGGRSAGNSEGVD
jgi:hypothetical protein